MGRHTIWLLLAPTAFAAAALRAGSSSSRPGRAATSRSARRCPSCGQQLLEARARRHLAFCAPDALDPEGWAQTDREVVLAHARATHAAGSPARRALELRFGGAGEPALVQQQQVARHMGWDARRTRDTIASLLHSVPPVAEPAGAPPLVVIHEDDSLIAVSKPAGVPCTPPHRLRPGSMLNRVVGHLDGAAGRAPGRRGAAVPAPVHRLDLQTSGVLVFAKTAAAATKLMSQFEARTVTKAYAALCAAPPVPGPGVSEGEGSCSGSPPPLVVEASVCRCENAERAERRVCAAGEAGQQARTTLTVLATAGAGPCLLLARPEQGRTHQVRLHCSHAGAPLLADEVYGRPGAKAAPGGLTRHALHAYALRCTHPATGRPLELLAPLPEDMRAAVAGLGLQPVAGRGGGADPAAEGLLRSTFGKARRHETPGMRLRSTSGLRLEYELRSAEVEIAAATGLHAAFEGYMSEDVRDSVPRPTQATAAAPPPPPPRAAPPRSRPSPDPERSAGSVSGGGRAERR